MTTRYVPKHPTVSTVNGTDVTNPLFIPRYTLQLVPGNTRPDPPVLIRDSARAAMIRVPSFTVSIVNSFSSPVWMQNTRSSVSMSSPSAHCRSASSIRVKCSNRPFS